MSLLMSQSNFHNTIELDIEDLEIEGKQVSKQEHLVLDIYKNNPSEIYSPFDVWNILTNRGYNYPITSIRRSVSDLTNENYLIKTSTKRDGMYGMKNFCWQYKNASTTVRMF